MFQDVFFPRSRRSSTEGHKNCTENRPKFVAVKAGIFYELLQRKTRKERRDPTHTCVHQLAKKKGHCRNARGEESRQVCRVRWSPLKTTQNVSGSINHTGRWIWKGWSDKQPQNVTNLLNLETQSFIPLGLLEEDCWEIRFSCFKIK